MVLVVIAYFLQKKYILFFRQEWPVECLHARLSWTLNNSVTFVLYCFVVFVSPRKPNLDDFRGFKPSIAKYAFFNLNFYNYV